MYNTLIRSISAQFPELAADTGLYSTADSCMAIWGQREYRGNTAVIARKTRGQGQNLRQFCEDGDKTIAVIGYRVDGDKQYTAGMGTE